MRDRLLKQFEHGRKQVTQGQHDYATDLFTQCVLGDPLNLEYVQAYVGNLQKKYGNNRTGRKMAQFFERGARAAVKKALVAKDWDEVIKQGLKVLTVNPWDKAALLAMATATEKKGNLEIPQHYLKWARTAAPDDPDINKACALSAASVHQFDGAIAMWHKVAQARPDDDEPQRAIASLTVQKTVALGGFREDEEGKIVDSHAQTKEQALETEADDEEDLSPEEKLRQKIEADPKSIAGYIELAQFFIHKGDYEKAEKVYADAYKASGGNEDVREHWEDIQLRRVRMKMIEADKQGEKELARKLRKDLIEKELDVYKGRCERMPNSLALKYQLGYRYQLAGQANEAIKQYQHARNDPRHKGDCMLRLGECFQKIKQNRLAMTHYEMAIAEIADREEESKKRALYLAGRMALFLKDVDKAEQYLTQLAGMDFTYRDVSDLLAKISKLREREKGGGKDEEGPGEIEDDETEL
ncbi:MAG TPA: hypothetical protein VMY42_07660 [Thermoguttaceae bacterium]|nr:hypothetical protein [Thermoguttaceae bacterium]